jgi:hypothetical protein
MAEAELIEAVCRAWWSDWPDVPNPNGARVLARKAVEAVTSQQERELYRTGTCPVCEAMHGWSDWLPPDLVTGKPRR